MHIPDGLSTYERIASARRWLQVVIVVRHRPEAFFNFNKWLSFIHEETLVMAKNVKQANKKELKKAEFAGFANVELNAEEKAEMRQWILETEIVQVELDEMLASLYKLSVQKSEALGSYQATAFCTDAKSPNAGLILSAYAPHWWDAMACLAYKHAVKCEGIWGKDADNEPDAWG
jgi:predicted TIM-barrel fold metal-dependent hydrolase